MWLEELRRMKQRSGLTSAEIAAGAGVPRPTLDKILSGETKDPRLPTMKKIVEFLGYTLNDLDPPKTENAPASEDAEALSVEEVMEAFYSAGLVPRGQDLTDEDLRFLLSVVAALRQWFGGESGK